MVHGLLRPIETGPPLPHCQPDDQKGHVVEKEKQPSPRRTMGAMRHVQQMDASDLRHLQRQGGSAVFERPVSGERLFDHVCSI